jgi:hypothetical protein
MTLSSATGSPMADCPSILRVSRAACATVPRSGGGHRCPPRPGADSSGGSGLLSARQPASGEPVFGYLTVSACQGLA